ncbi:MAG: chromosomal replication initiator protein DnaA [Bacteroidales bacterium]|nr:chromosomal replication initiator protein DnaA [Bacteroidales bacterium]
MGESNYIKVWEECLRIIKNNVPEAVYSKWFKPIIPVSLKDFTLTIEVPSDAYMRKLEEEPLIDILKKTLKRVIGEKVKLMYNVRVLSNSVLKYEHQTLEGPQNKDINIPIDDKEKMNPFVIPGIQKLNIKPGLNPKYSFENFIEGNCNRLARSAGETVAQAPGHNPFNPLFIHGGSGLGKTHLSQAIGLRVKELNPDKIVLYVSANVFKTQYQNAVVGNMITDFLHFYQQIDVLILDDVQEFTSKGTQNVFFHIFNVLHQEGKQLILTSDCAPSSLQGFEPRLLQRFRWGLSAELLQPDYSTRVKIFKAKSANEGIELPDDVVEYLANKVTGSVRELEGTILTLMAHSTYNKESITIELAKRVTKQIVNVESCELTLEKIKTAVCEYFKITPDMIVSKTRKREIVQARQITMYLVRNLTKTSLASIGSQMGGKDHATVLHACSTVSDLMDTDRNIRGYVADLERQLKPNK